MQILVNPAATTVDAAALRETAVDALGMPAKWLRVEMKMTTAMTAKKTMATKTTMATK